VEPALRTGTVLAALVVDFGLLEGVFFLTRVLLVVLLVIGFVVFPILSVLCEEDPRKRGGADYAASDNSGAAQEPSTVDFALEHHPNFVVHRRETSRLL